MIRKYWLYDISRKYWLYVIQCLVLVVMAVAIYLDYVMDHPVILGINCFFLGFLANSMIVQRWTRRLAKQCEENAQALYKATAINTHIIECVRRAGINITVDEQDDGATIMIGRAFSSEDEERTIN